MNNKNVASDLVLKFREYLFVKFNFLAQGFQRRCRLKVVVILALVAILCKEPELFEHF